MKDIIFFTFFNYFIIFILAFVYQLLGFYEVDFFIHSILPYFMLLFYIFSSFFIFRKYKVYKKNLSFIKLFLYFLFGVSLSILLNMIIMSFISNSSNNSSDFSYLFLIISSGIIGPIYEEILFRYHFYPDLRQKFSIRFSVFINAFIFGVFHISPIKVIYAFVIGIIFAYTYEKEKNIWYPIFIHMGANIISLFLAQFHLSILILSCITTLFYSYLIFKK